VCSSDLDLERILTDTEGCLLVSESNVTGEEGTYGGSQFTDNFAWNAEGEFYLNGQLHDGNCSAILTVTGSECDDTGEFGLECEEVDAFPIPNGNVHLEPRDDDLPSLVFAGLTSSYDGKRLGQLKMVMEVVDLDSDGMLPTEELGYVRLMLNGIPTENDYDFRVPLLAPETELSISAARRDSNYFYSVQAFENVTVNVDSVVVQDCEYEVKTYGPNCSITAYTLTSDDFGKTLTFDPATDTFCYEDMCYFYLVQKNREVTVKSVTGDDLAVLYKTNNFPTSMDYDVAMPGSTSFIPGVETETTAQLAVYSPTGNNFPTSMDYDVAMPGSTSFIPGVETETTAQLAVYSPTGNKFTIFLGEGAPNPPHDDDDDDDDDLPWAWIGVSIALGVIALALVTGFAIYTCKPPRTYISVE
jgi:hypothetical protein